MTEPTDSAQFFRPPPRQGTYGAPADGLPPEAEWAPPADGPSLAAPGWRLLARIIDWVIVWVIALPATGPLLARYVRHVLKALDVAAAHHPPVAPQVYDATTLRLVAGIGLILLGISFLYEAPQMARWGQTLGKRACRLRVVRRPGGPAPAAGPDAPPAAGPDVSAPAGLGARTAVLRWAVPGVAPALPWVGAPFLVLDAVWQLWDRPWRQCLHDKAAGTVVLRTPRETVPR